jgi:hypothetical protein
VPSLKLRRQAKAILRRLKIKSRFYRSEKPFIGYYNGKTETIHVATRGMDAQDFLSTVFHEIGHAIQTRHGFGMAYHMGEKPGYRNFRYWAMQGLPSERVADLIGKSLMGTYYPGLKFYASYDGLKGERFVHARVERIGRDKFPGRKCPLCSKIMKGQSR